MSPPARAARRRSAGASPSLLIASLCRLDPGLIVVERDLAAAPPPHPDRDFVRASLMTASDARRPLDADAQFRRAVGAEGLDSTTSCGLDAPSATSPAGKVGLLGRSPGSRVVIACGGPLRRRRRRRSASTASAPYLRYAFGGRRPFQLRGRSGSKSSTAGRRGGSSAHRRSGAAAGSRRSGAGLAIDGLQVNRAALARAQPGDRLARFPQLAAPRRRRARRSTAWPTFRLTKYSPLTVGDLRRGDEIDDRVGALLRARSRSAWRAETAGRSSPPASSPKREATKPGCRQLAVTPVPASRRASSRVNRMLAELRAAVGPHAGVFARALQVVEGEPRAGGAPAAAVETIRAGAEAMSGSAAPAVSTK